jgi:hypothetical protein
MKCFSLLYSRTAESDYRWIFIPPGTSKEEARLLSGIYDSFENYKEGVDLAQIEIAPTLCLHLSSSVIILQYVKTNSKDPDGKIVYALQGFSISHKYERDFWFVLPWILIDSAKYLNAWQYLNRELADQTRYDSSVSFEIYLDDLTRATPSVLEVIAKQEAIKLEHEPVELSYDNDGFIELLSYLMSPKVPAINFGFGISKNLLQKVENLQIVAFHE